MTLSLRNWFQILTPTEEQGECPIPNNNNSKQILAPHALSKIYFKFIQATHHAEILENSIQTNLPPPGMKRQVSRLTDFIKPACPNMETYNKIKLNTDEWIKRTLEILVEHYDGVMMEQLRVLDKFDNESFEKAIGWAKTRYKKKLTKTSIDRVRALVRDSVQDENISGRGERRESAASQGEGTRQGSIISGDEGANDGQIETQPNLNEQSILTVNATVEGKTLTSNSFPERAKLHELSLQSSTLDSFPMEGEDEEEDDFNYDLFDPTIHKASQRKILEWNLTINKAVLFIGDQNLARIPYFTEPDIQVDSFPEATLYHLSGVLQKLKPNKEVKKVILSVGLNNCLLGNETNTTKKQIQQLHRHCQAAFPSATIYLPLLNFSEKLKPQTIKRIEEFNTILMERYNFLPKLQNAKFRVNSLDNVQWLPGTASALLDSWLKELKLI